jgi:hypothetical protein
MAFSVTMANGEDQKLSTTIIGWIQESMADHVTNNAPLLKWLQERRRIQRGGVGLQLAVPLKYAAAGNPRLKGIADPTVANAPIIPRGVTRLKMDCAEVGQTYSIPVRDTVVQGDRTTVLKAAATYVELANDQWVSDLWAALMAAETATGSAGAEDSIASLRTIVNKGNNTSNANTFYGFLPHPAQSVRDDGNGFVAATHGAAAAGGSSAIVSIGGIDRSATDTGVLFSAPVFGYSSGTALSLALINKLITAASRGVDKPDIMFMDRDLFDTLLSALQSQQMLQPSKMASYGFTAIRFRDIEVLPDDNMPAGAYNGSAVSSTGQIMLLNSQALAFVAATEQPIVKSAPSMNTATTDYRVLDYCQLVPRILGRGLGARHTTVSKSWSS